MTTGTWYLLHDVDEDGMTFGSRDTTYISTGYAVDLESPNPGHKLMFYEDQRPSDTVVKKSDRLKIRDDSGHHNWWEEDSSLKSPMSSNPQYIDYTSNCSDSSGWWPFPCEHNTFQLVYTGTDPTGGLSANSGILNTSWGSIRHNHGDTLQLSPVS